MMLSALAYQRHVGPIYLFGTRDAILWAREQKLSALYDADMTFTERPSIDHRIFWASAKLYALEQMIAPCCITDIDCVLYAKPNTIMYDAMALHSEPYDWDIYKFSPMFLRVAMESGVSCPPRSMKYPPSNTAVMSIHDEDFRQAYVQASMRIMEAETKDPWTDPNKTMVSGGSPLAQMVCSEQHLFSAVATAMNKRLGFITNLSLELDHMPHNPKAMHLWNKKAHYAKHARAKDYAMSFLMEKLYQYGHNRWEVSLAARKNGLPTVRVMDSTTGMVRWSHEGEWKGPGDIIGEI